jgi:hypothetical protein
MIADRASILIVDGRITREFGIVGYQLISGRSPEVEKMGGWRLRECADGTAPKGAFTGPKYCRQGKSNGLPTRKLTAAERKIMSANRHD